MNKTRTIINMVGILILGCLASFLIYAMVRTFIPQPPSVMKITPIGETNSENGYEVILNEGNYYFNDDKTFIVELKCTFNPTTDNQIKINYDDCVLDCYDENKSNKELNISKNGYDIFDKVIEEKMTYKLYFNIMIEEDREFMKDSNVIFYLNKAYFIFSFNELKNDPIIL